MKENSAKQLRLVVFPIIYKVSYIPGGCWISEPSTVWKKQFGVCSASGQTNPRRLGLNKVFTLLSFKTIHFWMFLDKT